MPRPYRATRCQRLIQLLSLGLFIYLFSRAVGEPQVWSSGFFLKLDPVVATILALSGQLVWPGLLLWLITALAGRLFCGYVCPFGLTLDLVRGLKRLIFFRAKPKPPRPLAPRARFYKFFGLTALMAAAVAGLNLYFWAAPIPLVTRFYALLLYPAFTRAAHLASSARAFDGLAFMLIFFGLVFWLEWRWPRFWCRVLCPAGSILALFSRGPLWRRRVADTCTGCGRCRSACPAGAISPDGRSTLWGECFTCRACQEVCPTRAVRFGLTNRPGDRSMSAPATGLGCTRRALLGSAAAGLALAWGQSAGATAALGLAGYPLKRLVRPPGARPEDQFLLLCLRCGACYKVCPTNGLAPAGLAGGLAGLFSPFLLARRGPCEPSCARCGQACPSGAIPPLPLTEKSWAKMGTAVVLKETCLAWAEGRRCVVCQEVCPYGAVNLAREPGGLVAAPVINPARCFGCGYCQKHCPVSQPAIVVEAAGALRLEDSQYQREGLARGLKLGLDARPDEEIIPDDQPPPGFLELK
ncbi:MAG: 4Fe-4S binding protein [Candidatus Adiutrix sp.]|jgi:MauM/NapG family ferredoxin protein|nr:4Fe-4S binding protein [Candidatus Adiutrix sp.]